MSSAKMTLAEFKAHFEESTELPIFSPALVVRLGGNELLDALYLAYCVGFEEGIINNDAQS